MIEKTQMPAEYKEVIDKQVNIYKDPQPAFSFHSKCMPNFADMIFHGFLTYK